MRELIRFVGFTKASARINVKLVQISPLRSRPD
jgi:hypothetical protein